MADDDPPEGEESQSAGQPPDALPPAPIAGASKEGATVTGTNAQKPKNIIDRLLQRVANIRFRVPETIMAAFTVVIACAAIAQCHEMNTSGTDTKHLAEAASKQALSMSSLASDTANEVDAARANALAASDQAVAMSSMAVTQSGQLETLKKSVKAAEATANAAKAQADAAQGQLTVMRTQQRPWVEIVDARPVQVVNDHGNLNVAISISLKNLGATPATGIEIQPGLNVVSGETMGSVQQDEARVCAIAARNYQARLSGMSLAPGEVKTITTEPTMAVTDVKPIAPQLGQLRQGGAFAVFGCIDYIIADGEPHGRTYFRYIISRKRPPSKTPFVIYLDEGNLTSDLLTADLDDFQGNYSK